MAQRFTEKLEKISAQTWPAAWLPQQKTRAILAVILALALVLRMGRPGLAEFKRDEATVVSRAWAIAYAGELPAAGVGASVGISNLPLFLYVAALPLRLWSDPLAVILFVGLLNGLAVGACCLLGRIYFNRAVGLVAAFLFAVNPWAIIYGRKIWSQNLPLVTLGFMLALLATFAGGRRWALAGACVGLAALIGLHLGGLAFIPVLIVPMILYRKRVSRWPLLAGASLFVLSLSPYVIDDALHGWANLRGLAHYGSGTRHLSLDALRYAFYLTGSQDMHTLAGGRFQDYLAGLPDMWWLNNVMMGLLGLSLIYAAVQIVAGPPERRRVLVLLLLWFAVPIALQSAPSAPVYPHYFILLYPVQFLLISFMMVDGTSRILAAAPRPNLKRFVHAALLLLAMVWGGWQIAVIGRMFVFMERYPTTGGYGIPLKYPRQAAQAARRLAGSDEIIILSAGQDPNVDETPAVFQALLFNHPHRFADGRWALPIPEAAGVVYVAGPLQAPSDLAVLPQLASICPAGQARASVPLPDGFSYQIYDCQGPWQQAGLDEWGRLREPASFANGVSFVGSRMSEQIQAGETLEVWLAWQVRSLPPAGADYHFFTHLLDQEGRLRGQHDGVPFAAVSWRPGDLVLSRFAIPLPPDLAPGAYRVRAGMYTFPDIAGVPVIDVAGNPASDAVEIGSVSVTADEP